MNHNMVAAVIDAAGILFIQFGIFEIVQLIGLEKHQTPSDNTVSCVVWAKGSLQPCNFHRELVHPCEMYPPPDILVILWVGFGHA